MTIRRTRPLFIFVSALLSALSFSGALGDRPVAHAQERPAQGAWDPRTTPLDRDIPIDPQITVGTLPNGLRYYIRRNQVPENRAELRLVVNAGSVLEDDDQQGLAHFVEHMAFNGSTHFAKNELVRFMESIGMRMGPSINAFTGFDETVYMLQVPTDKREVMEKAFLMLEDWAHNLTFDPAEIDKERGVIVEEWRLGRGAGARIQDKQFPILMKGSRYAERLPIGKKEIVEAFKPERLKQFYADWYRPDLMAVVAVGDFDAPALEGLIKQHFASIPNPSRERPRRIYDVPDHPGTLYAIATDKEMTMTSVSVYNKLPIREQHTVGGYRQRAIDTLYLGMLNNRLADSSRKPDPPFIGANAGRGIFVKSKEAATLSALVRDGGVERGLEALFTESERVGRFGFTATELERQKKEMLRQYESLFAERDKHNSATLAAEYIRNFTQGESLPGIAAEYAMQQRFLPGITLDEVNRLAALFTADRSRVVLVSGPQKEVVTLPDEAKLAAVIKDAATRKLEPYVDTVQPTTLLEAPPKAGSIAKTTVKDNFGIVEWDLSNGAKVVLRPTMFKADDIQFRAASFGGTSLAGDQDFVAAMTAAEVVSAGGLGKFDSIALRKALAGKVVTVRPVITDTEQGLVGSASPKDLETLFQLIYLNFTQPRADANMFTILTTQTKAILANQKASPAWAFNEALQGALTQNHFRARPFTAEIVDEMNLEKSMAFYRDRFADASGFTFFFVGSFEVEKIKPLVEQYIASLPSLNRHETWKDVGIRPPRGVVTKTVAKGIEPKSQAAIVFSGTYQSDLAHDVVMRALASVVETKLRDTLREDLGGTYSVTVSAGVDKIPQQRYTVSIGFGCNPDRTEDLVKAVFRTIDEFRTAGPNEKQVSDVREQLLRAYETNMNQNVFHLGQIYNKYMFKLSLQETYDLPGLYRKLTAAAIQEAARAYLDPQNYVRVTLMPEKKSSESLSELPLDWLWRRAPVLHPVPGI